MEIKANPESVATESSNLSETIQNAIEKNRVGDESEKEEAAKDKSEKDESDKKYSKSIESTSIEKVQQLLKDMGLEEGDLEDLLLERNSLESNLLERKGKLKATPTIIESVKDNAVTQVKQFGASTIASLIAILIAVITPIILNSQFAQDISETIADIRKKLPNEADDLLMSQVSELTKNNQVLINQISTEQRLLQAKNVELSKGEQSFKLEYQSVTQKLIELENQNRDLTELLSKKVEQLEGRFAGKQEKPNYALLKQLSNLTREGENLTATQTEKSERWFKQTFYTVQGLQTEAFNQQLKTHVAVLKSIVEKESEFGEFNKRKEEALIVLEALSSLVNAAIIR